MHSKNFVWIYLVFLELSCSQTNTHTHILHIHTYTHTYIHTYTHTHIHTYKPRWLHNLLAEVTKYMSVLCIKECSIFIYLPQLLDKTYSIQLHSSTMTTFCCLCSPCCEDSTRGCEWGLMWSPCVPWKLHNCTRVTNCSRVAVITRGVKYRVSCEMMTATLTGDNDRLRNGKLPRRRVISSIYTLRDKSEDINIQLFQLRLSTSKAM
jgi:hypothetical protein